MGKSALALQLWNPKLGVGIRALEQIKKPNNRINLTILYTVSLRYTSYKMASYAGVGQPRHRHRISRARQQGIKFKSGRAERLGAQTIRHHGG